jgi:hypothetical protein
MSAAINREISVADFYRWLMLNSWNMHQDSSQSAIDLASELHLLFAERDDLILDDAAILRQLAALANSRDVKVLNVQFTAPQTLYVFRPLSPSRQNRALVSVQL